jgi:selenocysteine-specific elongation factor
MVAGATGIDIALLVVAADDSVMPQTVEHLEILRLLGIERAVVAITKCDMVDAPMVELVQEEVRELLRGGPQAGSGAAESGLADAEIVAVSSVTGFGLDELRQAILRASNGVVRPATSTPFRMAVDRVFTVQGRGTVVTGSVLRGRVCPGDALEVFPGKLACRVRDMQTHGAAEQELARGQRAALNLGGTTREEIARGSELATPGYLEPSHILDVKLDYLGTCDKLLRSAQKGRLEMGTAEVPVRVVLHEGDRLAPGQSAYAQLRSGEPIVSAYGQRFILRDESAVRTLGGGRVLRPVTRRRRADEGETVASLKRLDSGDAVARVEEVLRVSGFRTPTALQICLRAGVEVDEVPGLLERLERDGRWQRVGGTETRATPGAMEDLAARLLAWLERYHRSHPELPGRSADSAIGWLERVTGQKALARPFLEDLLRRKVVSRLGKFVAKPSFAPSLSGADEKLLAEMIEEIRRGEFQPPALNELRSAATADKKRIGRLATLAMAMGELVSIDGAIYLHSANEAKLRSVVAEAISREGAVTVSQVREALQTSRKYAVPFLEYLDRVGFTKRVGDQRILSNSECRIANSE